MVVHNKVHSTKGNNTPEFKRIITPTDDPI